MNSDDMLKTLIINNDRDRRTLDWLRSQVDDAAIANAICQLSGSRKPYVSNVCKQLGLVAPAVLEITSKEKAQEHLAAIRQKLALPKRM